MSKVISEYPKLVIETDRLLIRHFQKGDSEGCFGFLSDREDCYNDGGYEPFEEMDEEYQLLMDKFEKQSMRKILIDKESGEVVGTINVMTCEDRVVETFEIGYVICKKKQRRGFGFEAVSKVCEVLLEELGAEMIIAGAIEKNEASHKMLDKLGFQFEGRKTKSFYHPIDGNIDLLYYVLERK